MTELAPLTHYLCEAIDTSAANIERISIDIEHAGELLIQTLLSDRKIIVCGNGLSSAIGNVLSACLISQQEFDRPSLPAVNISPDSTSLLAISKTHNPHQIFSHQINSLGHEGDTLITLSIDGNCSNIIQAIQAAHEKNIRVINITGNRTDKISAVLQTDDIDIKIDSDSVARVLEIQLLVVNSICHHIETLLFGGTH
jgi:phosphoheptose isomerase